MVAPTAARPELRLRGAARSGHGTCHPRRVLPAVRPTGPGQPHRAPACSNGATAWICAVAAWNTYGCSLARPTSPRSSMLKAHGVTHRHHSTGPPAALWCLPTPLHSERPGAPVRRAAGRAHCLAARAARRRRARRRRRAAPPRRACGGGTGAATRREPVGRKGGGRGGAPRVAPPARWRQSAGRRRRPGDE